MIKNKKALICGITGQDGSYLAELLLDKGYIVWGTSRNPQIVDITNLRKLKIDQRIKLIKLEPSDFKSVVKTISEIEPHEIYNLMGPSSVASSFAAPMVSTMEIIAPNINFLEAIRISEQKPRYYS